MNLRESKHWDKQLEGGLPDSRLRSKPTVMRARMLWERVFCANCGTEGGLITAEWACHCFFICDECSSKHGPLDLPQIDDVTVSKITRAS